MTNRCRLDAKQNKTDIGRVDHALFILLLPIWLSQETTNKMQHAHSNFLSLRAVSNYYIQSRSYDN